MSASSADRARGVMTARVKRTLLTLALGLATAAGAQEAAPTLPQVSLTRFFLNDGGRGGLGAATGDTLAQFRFRATFGVHYEHNPLMYYRGDAVAGALVAHRVQLDLGLAFGITSWLQVSGQLPMMVAQSGDDLAATAGVRTPDAFGLGSPRVALRVGLLSQGHGGLLGNTPLDLALQVGVALPFGVGGAANIESGWNFAPQLSLGHDFGPVRLGGEVTALVRDSVALSSGSARDAVSHQLGLRLLLTTMGQYVRFEGSFHSLIPMTAGGVPPGFEVLGGVRVPIGPLELFALGGPGFGGLPGTPAVRVYAGLGLKPWSGTCEAGSSHLPSECPDLDDDGDGVRNAIDRCPTDAEDLDGYQDADGCPDPDNDGDGIADVDDKCPMQAGVLEDRGCPLRNRDSDGDGVPDAQDRCPTIPGVKEKDGCPVKDQDRDGIEDELDACPTQPGPVERQGCPLKDRDGDQVEDHVDNCPDEPGTVDNHGCPAKQKQLVIITQDKLVITDKVYFATGKASILPRSFELLNQVASVLRNHPEIPLVTVEGHTDDRGSAKVNRKLSLARAKAVKAYLEHQGIDTNRLNAMGFGPDRPADTNKTEAGRAANRRVEFIIEHDVP